MVASRTPVRLAVLGPLAVAQDGEDVTPRSALQRRLLALLVLRAPRPVPVDALMDVAWPDGDLPKEPRENLQTHLSRLRRHLDDDGQRVIVTEPGGYRLEPGRYTSDLDELTRATTDDEDDDGAGRLARIEAALGLWRGPSLADIADTEVAAGDATRLDEIRLSLTEARFERLSELDPDPRIVGELEAFTLEHPYRERPHAILMELLYHLGRQADALGTYQRLRSRLAEDLGLEPSAALRELESQILGQSVVPPAHAVVGVRSGPAAVVRRRPGPPAAATTLVGRGADLDRLRQALGRSRLVTITGPGGVGKTRVAMAMGHELAARRTGGPVVWCDLTPATNEAEVLEVVGRALGTHRRRGQTPREAIVESTTGVEPTVLLDNCEHVADAVAALVCEVLAASPSVPVVATARSPLDVAGEELVALEPMPWEETADARDRPPAIELFWQRAAAVGSTLADDERTRTLVRLVCRAVDGLPLGIELAAAQLRHTTLEELADRVMAAAEALDITRRSGAPRHRSIRSALSWSLDALPTADRRFFEMLSVFPGSFDAMAAAAVTRSPVDVAAARLHDLADLCLVDVDTTGSRTRFRLLRTSRLIGQERAEADGITATLLDRHRTWVVRLVERTGPLCRGRSEADAVRAIEADIDNVRSVVRRAVAVGDADTALVVIAALSDYALHRMRDDIVDWAEQALAIAGAEQHPLCASAMALVAMGATSRGDFELARALGSKVVDGRAASTVAMLDAHHALSLVALYSGALAEAAVIAAEHLRLAEAADDPYDGQFAAMITALAAHYGGDDDGARTWARRSRALAERSGAPSSVAWSDYVYGEVLAAADPSRARSHFESAIAAAGSVGNEVVSGVARLSLTTLPFEAGHEEALLRAYAELIDSWSARNDWTHQWTTLQNLVPLLSHCGAHADAAVILGALTSERGGTRIFGEAAKGIAALRDELSHRLGDDELDRLRVLASSLTAREVVERAKGAIARLLGDGDDHRS